jgi:hypothetical protein
VKDAEVRGLDDLEALTRALKAAGDSGTGLRRELYAGLNRATKHTREQMKKAIPGALPTSGGLAAEVASTASFTATATGSGANTGVRIKGRRRGRKGSSLARMNAGVVRHPVFGNRSVWVDQTAGVTKGFLDEEFQQDKPELRDAVIEVIQSVRAQIYRKV